MTFEATRILDRIGADVQVFDPCGLPIKDEVSVDHPEVQELGELSNSSDGHF
jgi:arsenical resistance protein ArsH